MKKLITRTIVSLTVALGLAVGLLFAVSGCATITSLPDTEIVLPEQYNDMQMQPGGVAYKIPKVVGDLQDSSWRVENRQLSKAMFAIFFTKGDEAVSMLVKFDGKVATIMALVYVKKVNGEVEAMYWIFNGKAYPKKVDKEEMDAYSKMLFSTK